MLIMSTILEMGTFCLQTDSMGIFLLILHSLFLHTEVEKTERNGIFNIL